MDRGSLIKMSRAHHLFAELIITDLYGQVLKPGDCFLDVGASKGHHTILMAQRVGPTGFGIAVEAIPFNVEEVEEKLARLGISWVRMHKVAVSNVEGEADFFVRTGYDGWSSLFAEHVHPDDQTNPDVFKTKIRLLDDEVLDEIVAPLTFFKIDIEHSEFNALRGATKMLAAHRPVICFENAPLTAASICNYSMEEFFAFFNRIGYDLYDLFLYPFDAASLQTPGELAGYYAALPRERFAGKNVRELFDIEAVCERVGRKLELWPGPADQDQPGSVGRHQFASKIGEPFHLDIPPTTRTESVFAMSIQEAGSVLFDDIVSELAQSGNYPIVSVERTLFAQGVRPLDWPKEIYGVFNAPGYIFNGMRGIGRLDQFPAFGRWKKLILIRHPLDMLTSFYFSIARGRAVPPKGDLRARVLEQRQTANSLDINQYIMAGHGDGLMRSYMKYVTYLSGGPSNATVYRYEDVIFNTSGWVRDIARNVDIHLSEAEYDRIAAKHDVAQARMDRDAHTRQVEPGHYAEYLTVATANRIKSEFPQIFSFFKYQ